MTYRCPVCNTDSGSTCIDSDTILITAIIIIVITSNGNVRHDDREHNNCTWQVHQKRICFHIWFSFDLLPLASSSLCWGLNLNRGLASWSFLRWVWVKMWAPTQSMLTHWHIARTNNHPQYIEHTHIPVDMMLSTSCWEHAFSAMAMPTICWWLHFQFFLRCWFCRLLKSIHIILIRCQKNVDLEGSQCRTGKEFTNLLLVPSMLFYIIISKPLVPLIRL